MLKTMTGIAGLDPTSSAVVTGVLANAVTSAIATAGRAVWRGFEKPVIAAGTRNGLEVAVRTEIAKAARSLSGQREADDLRLALMAPEVETIIRRLISVNVSSAPADSSILALQGTFKRVLSVLTGRADSELDSISAHLILAILDGIAAAIEERSGSTQQRAAEAAANLRTRVVVSELAAIRGALANLVGQTAQSVQIGRAH